jgi:hypothetical protein
MAFCPNCGAQVSGEFCTACGTRSKTSDAPQAGPLQAMPVAAPPAARKTSPLVWILVAVAGVIVLFGLAVVGGGLFLVHKAKQAGFDTELMRNNPGLATAKLLAATNPDLEVISSDQHGVITIRQRSTGKIMTMSFDDMKGGKFSFKADGDGGSVNIGAGQAAVPAWIPSYPNSKPASIYSVNGKDGASASFQFQTRDAPKDIVAFYEAGLKQAGFRISMYTANGGGGSSGGMLSADDAANKRTVTVTVGNGSQGTTVGVTYSQR